MSKRQKNTALRGAKIYPEPEKGGRGKTANAVVAIELTDGYLSQFLFHRRVAVRLAFARLAVAAGRRFLFCTDIRYQLTNQ